VSPLQIGSPTKGEADRRVEYAAGVLRRRCGRTAVTLRCAVVAVALTHLGADAVHPANSARTERHFAVAPKQEQVRKAPSWSPVAAAKQAPAYGIAFFGDSVSVGSGASNPDHGYVARVWRWLERRRKRVVATVNAKGGVPVAYWEYAPIPKKLDAAVVELGTNDIRFRTPSVQFAREYRMLTGRIRARNPKAQLLCLSVWPRPTGASLEHVINARIRAVCPGTYLDITRLRYRSHIRSSDGFHPNDVGHRLIARAVESKLKTD
jgi:acyl-CoA thioesterase I